MPCGTSGIGTCSQIAVQVYRAQDDKVDCWQGVNCNAAQLQVPKLVCDRKVHGQPHQGSYYIETRHFGGQATVVAVFVAGRFQQQTSKFEPQHICFSSVVKAIAATYRPMHDGLASQLKPERVHIHYPLLRRNVHLLLLGSCCP